MKKPTVGRGINCNLVDDVIEWGRFRTAPIPF